MATHDYYLENQTGAEFRADLNDVLQAVLTLNSSATEPTTTAAYMLWLDTANGVLKIRNGADDAWVILPLSISADNTVDIDGGTIDGISQLTLGSSTSVNSILDEDNLNSDSPTALATQQSIKAYVDSQVTAQDLDFQGDSGGVLSIDLDSEIFTLNGGTGIDTVGSENTVQFNIDSTVVTLVGVQVLTNKSIDADNNTITNLEVDNLKAGVLDTDLDAVSASDDTLASAKAIKTYVDANITAQDLDVSDGTTSIAIDLDSETLSLLGGTGVSSTASGNGVTFAIGQPVGTTDNVSFGVVTANLTGQVSDISNHSTSDLSEGTNLYYTTARFDTRLATKDTDDLTEGSNLYYTQARFDSAFGNKTTANLTENTNLYYTDARSRAAISASGDLSYNSSTGVISFTASAAPVTSVNTLTGVVVLTTANISENTNLYYTDARARAAISEGSTQLSYDSGTGVLTYTQGNTDTVAEGTTNLYYTTARFDSAFGNKTTANLTENTNLYYTDTRARSAISATGDISYNSSTGVISFTQSASPVTSVNTLTGAVVLTTANISENTNLYFTDARARAAISESSTQLAYNSTTGVLTFTQGDTDTVSEGTTNLYYTDARVQAVSINNVVEDTTPQLGGNLDVNGNAIISTSNGAINLDPNGSGVVVFKGNATKGSGQFKLNCEANTHGITIKGPPHSAGADYTLTLPNDDGSSNQVLTTDGSGVLSWSTPSSGGSTTLLGLTDVGSDGTNGQVLTTNGSGSFTFTTVSGGGGSYNDASVDAHLNTGTASNGQVLSWNGSDYDWVPQSGGGGGGSITFKTFGTDSIMVGDDVTGTINASNYNTGLGVDVFASLATGSVSNTVIGYKAGTSLASYDSHNTFVGANAGELVATTGNVAIGSQALATYASPFGCVAIGHQAMQNNDTPNSTNLRDIIAIGNYACQYYKEWGQVPSVSGDTVAIGPYAHQGTITNNIIDTYGYANIAIGLKAMKQVQTAARNIAIGVEVMSVNTLSGADNVAIGYRSMYRNTSGANNVALGSQTLQANTSGQYNFGMGAFSLFSNTTGTGNVGIGMSSVQDCTTGQYNTGVGRYAAKKVTTGRFNVHIGEGDPFESGMTTTGYSNVMIGAKCSASASSNDNEIVIGGKKNGYGTDTIVGKGASTGFINAGDGAVYQGNNSASWATTSDRRIKKNIEDNDTGLNVINNIRVRNFEYRTQDEITDFENSASVVIHKEGVQLGVIAQEIEEILPDVVRQESTGVKSVNPDNLTWYLVNAVKELSAQVEELKKKVGE